MKNCVDCLKGGVNVTSLACLQVLIEGVGRGGYRQNFGTKSTGVKDEQIDTHIPPKSFISEPMVGKVQNPFDLSECESNIELANMNTM